MNQIANRFGAVAILPDVKGPERSAVKVNVRYGGDASQLSDVVRATIKFKMHRDVLGDMYGAVETLINWVKFNGARVSVVFFADRYQNPFKGGYKDHGAC